CASSETVSSICLRPIKRGSGWCTCSKPDAPSGTETMSKKIQDAYIVAATRLPVAKRRGMYRNVRPDDMLAHAIRSVMAKVPELDPALVGDVVCGCAMPEAEQGMNVARIGLLLA